MKAFKDFRKTESALYARIRNAMANHGILIRMENLIVPGLPDCIFIFSHKTLFIELKIVRGGKITMPKHQYSIAVDMKNHIDPNSHWYFTYEDDGMGNDLIGVYRFSDIAHILPEKSGNYIQMDIRNSSPMMMFTKSSDLQDWLMYLKGTT